MIQFSFNIITSLQLISFFQTTQGYITDNSNDYIMTLTNYISYQNLVTVLYMTALWVLSNVSHSSYISFQFLVHQS